MSPRTIIGPNGQTIVRGGRHSVHNRKACNTCRQRKGRCDGNGVDPCSWCLSKSHTCNYNPEDGRGPSWNKQTIETHKNLEKNLLDANEALLSQLAALKAYIRQLGGSPPPELTTRLEIRDEVQALCEQTRHLVLQDDKQFSLHGEWSPWVNMGPSRPAINTPITPPSPSEEVPDTIDYRSAIYSLPNAWRRYLPEDAVIDPVEHDRTCDLFFKFFASWGLRVIAQLYWRDMYRALLAGENNSNPPLRTAHWSPFLQNAILAVALALSDKQSIRHRHNRDRFAKKAKSELERECSAPLISTLSGFFCLGTYHSTLSEQSLAFVYLGISVRMCRALGLNVSCSQWVESGHITKADELDRHWGFWMTYCQEIWWSVYLGREFSLNIANACIPIPTPEALPHDDIPWVLPGVDDVPRSSLYNETFVEGCKLCIIVTKIMQTVYGLDRKQQVLKADEVQNIITELNEWYAALPSTLLANSTSLPHILMLHLAFWWCMLLLHRPVYRLDRNPESTARKACIQAAEKICELIDFWKSRYTLRFVPVTMMSIIFSAGTTWVLVASESQQAIEQRQTYLRYAGKCVSHLEHAERLWESASQLRVMLARLLSEQHNKLRATAEAPSSAVDTGADSSISAGSTRNPTPAPIIPPSSRNEQEHGIPISDPSSSVPGSMGGPPTSFHREAQYGGRADSHFNSGQGDPGPHFGPHHFHQSTRYAAQSAQAQAFLPGVGVWSQVQGTGSFPYHSPTGPTQIHTQTAAGHPPPAPDWTMNPQYWMEVGDNLHLSGNGYFSPQGQPGSSGHRQY